jgi:ABC-type uncharacterized transport system substrate-binding protein
MAADNGQVVEEAHAESHNGRIVELNTQAVAYEGQKSSQDSINAKATDENLVIVLALQLGPHRAQYRI